MSIFIVNLEVPLKTIVLGAFSTQTSVNKFVSSYIKENNEFIKVKKNDDDSRVVLYSSGDKFIVLNKVNFNKKAEKSEKIEKKPLSGYLLFCKENRDQVKKEHSDFTFIQITKCLGEKWRNLSDEEKRAFNKTTNE